MRVRDVLAAGAGAGAEVAAGVVEVPHTVAAEREPEAVALAAAVDSVVEEVESGKVVARMPVDRMLVVARRGRRRRLRDHLPIQSVRDPSRCMAHLMEEARAETNRMRSVDLEPAARVSVMWRPGHAAAR